MKALFIAPAAFLAAAALPSAASAEKFNGPFIGAQVGWSQNKVDSTGAPTLFDAVEGQNDAVTGGVFAGYDYKITSGIVIGAEAGITAGVDDEFDGGVSGRNVSIDPKYSIDATVRAGYLVDEQTLLYVRGGYSNVRVGVGVDDESGTRYEKANRDAWVVGGGAEHAITPSVSARLEYRYSDVSEGRGSWDRHQVLLGWAYHF